MTIACPGCGTPCPSHKKKCVECRRKDELAEVFRESDKELGLEVVQPDLKLAEVLPKVGSPEANEGMDDLDNLSPEDQALVDSVQMTETRLFGTRVRIGQKNKGVGREYIAANCYAAVPRVKDDVADRYAKHGKPAFEGRTGCVALLSYREHFMVKQADRTEMPTMVKGEPQLFTAGCDPVEVAEKALLTLFKHLPEVYADCRPEGRYLVEITLKWVWPTGNVVEMPPDHATKPAAETVH